jgi:hypothetical protein
MAIHTLWEGMQALIVGTIIVLFLLSRATRRYPHVEWLQSFKFNDPRTEEQKRRARRTGEIMGGIELIGIGAAAPPVYLLSTVFMFSNPNPAILAASIVFGVAFILLGIRAIVKARHY